MAIEADLEASPWEGGGLGSLRVSRHPGCPQAAPPDAREQSASHRCRRRGGNPHDGRSSLMPRTSCGAPMAFGWVDDGWVDIHRPSIGTPSASAGMCASEATASPPFSRSPWALRGCRLDLRRCGSGVGLADGSRLPVSVGPLHQPDQVLGIQPSYAFVAEPQTNGVAERFNRTLKEQIIHGHLPQHRGAAGRRPRLRRSTMPSGSSKRTAT